LPGLTLQGERRSLRDLAYETLRDAIVRAKIAPGAAVTEERLAQARAQARKSLHGAKPQEAGRILRIAIAAPTRPATIRPASTGPSSRVSETTTTLGMADSAEKRAKPV